MATVTPSIPDNQNNHKDEAIRKRTRATAEQLTVLEDTFAVNVSPNSKLRKQLADQLKMTDRSIQIWFQNRRAKVKHMQKRAQLQMHQASMRAQLYHYQQQHYYLQQHYAPHQRAHSLDSYKYHRSTAAANATATSLSTISEPGLINQQRQSVPPPSLPYAEMVDLHPDPWAISDDTTINPTHLNVDSYNLGLSISSLSIGRWHRLKMQPKDLECVYKPDRQLLCWNIVDGIHHFRMEIPVASIQQMAYSSPSSLFNGSGSMEASVAAAATVMGELHLDLYYSPLFYMKHQQEWISCSDFTEHQQASQVLHHTLKGIGMTLWQELSTLMATCPETQQWIQLISSPSSCSSVSSGGSASSFTDGMTTTDLSTNANSIDYHQPLPASLPMTSSSPALASTATATTTAAESILATTTKCDNPFATAATTEFLVDPLLMDPSLWSSANGFMIS
ncbi:homeobox domain-domain-containing protein [Absidia repens]|uniref:Homeobox domain-domain-containing protein n=1 Tax=Absidia repens TaxID=90262 RepID=A0A1X2J0V3_9FUNG|nr:homeobox domain-domain-containing protein [Absidia repens]